MASNSLSSYSKTLPNSCPPVLVSNDLMRLIKDPVDEKEVLETSQSNVSAQLTTMDDLLMHLKYYIKKNNLFDPANPIKIIVHETELGSLLGKSEFTLCDVRDILFQKFVFPVEPKSLNTIQVPKRRIMEDIFDSELLTKRNKVADGYTSEESVHSFQGYETEFVKDSTSTSFSDDNFSVNGVIFAETFDVDVEYEIEAPSDTSDFSCDTDSDVEDFVKNTIITFIARSCDSDLEYLADGSSDESQSEHELSEEDKWRCLSCNTLNDPRWRCCEACWQTRVGWLSESSGDARERKNKALARNRRKLFKRLNKNKVPDRKLSDLPSVTADSASSPSTSNDNKDIFQSPSSSFQSDKECSKKSDSGQQLCLFCCAKPADSSLLHGKVGCKICCFKCGKRLFDTNKRCPVCRRVIERVVYLFNS